MVEGEGRLDAEAGGEISWTVTDLEIDSRRNKLSAAIARCLAAWCAGNPMKDMGLGMGSGVMANESAASGLDSRHRQRR